MVAGPLSCLRAPRRARRGPVAGGRWTGLDAVVLHPASHRGPELGPPVPATTV